MERYKLFLGVCKMRDYKQKYMTEEMNKQFIELYNNGYADILSAFAADCIELALEEYRDGYKQGRIDAEKAARSKGDIVKLFRKRK